MCLGERVDGLSDFDLRFILGVCFEQANPEDGPFWLVGVDTDASSHGLREVFDDRQPQPGSADITRAPVVDAIEPLEDPGAMLGVETWAIVGDFDANEGSL